MSKNKNINTEKEMERSVGGFGVQRKEQCIGISIMIQKKNDRESA